MTSREQFEAFLVGEYEWANDTLNAAQFHGDDVTGYYTGGDFIYDGQSCSECLFWAWRGWQAASKASEQQLSESRREFTAANTTIHNLELKVEQVVAENARCKFEVSRCHQTVDEMFKHREKWVDKEWLSSIWSTSKRLMNETPVTDAAIANIQAQGVDMVIAAKKHQREIMHADTFGYGAAQESLRTLINQLESFAAQLRQGAEL